MVAWSAATTAPALMVVLGGTARATCPHVGALRSRSPAAVAGAGDALTVTLAQPAGLMLALVPCARTSESVTFTPVLYRLIGNRGCKRTDRIRIHILVTRRGRHHAIIYGQG